jgi:NAD-dependent SIR2 family protein deacetylase
MSQAIFIDTDRSLLRRGIEDLIARFQKARRVVAITGAGVSTECGIPDYRDARGEWKRRPPLRYQQFVSSAEARRRYWLRSMLGFPLVRDAAPGRAHHALAALERSGRLHHLITQNVDGLHQKAGASRIIDLHGRIDRVLCLGCGERGDREALQDRLRAANPAFEPLPAIAAPDGDADLDRPGEAGFEVPGCLRCEGVLKPDVVFFGESVPRERVTEALGLVDEADLLLVAGTSLMVWSGYRFVKRARERGVDVAALNLGRTRADGELALKIVADAGEVLARVVLSLP